MANEQHNQLAESAVYLANRFYGYAKADFPDASDERLRKFTLDYMKWKAPRLMELISEEILWPECPPIAAAIFAEDAESTMAFLRASGWPSLQSPAGTC